MNKSSKKSHPLYSLIYTATDNYLTAEDEELNKQICSEILRSPDSPKIASKIISKIINKSLSGHCYQSIWYSLLLLDVAVKSTDSKFCAAILTKEFLGDLMKVLDPKYGVPEFVQEKLLYILKEWHSSLTNVNGYINLAKFYKSCQPSQFQTNLPVANQRLYPTDKMSSFSISQQHFIPPLNANCKDKIIHDIDIMETNLTIFSDTLRSINLENISSEEVKFLKELYETNIKMQQRINEILPYIVWEDVINQLIQTNDKILSSNEKYKRLLKNKSSINLKPNNSLHGNNSTINDIYDSAHHQNPVMESRLTEIYDSSSLTRDNIPKDLRRMEAIGGSLPSYSEAVSFQAKNKKTDKNDLNLICFDDDDIQLTNESYKNKPLPPIPDGNQINTNASTVPDQLSSNDFDEFIELIAKRQQAPISEPLEEIYAPPLYDEAALKPNKY